MSGARDYFDPFDGLGDPVLVGHVLVFGDEGRGQHARTRCVRWVEALRRDEPEVYEALAAAHYWKGDVSLMWFPGSDSLQGVRRFVAAGTVREALGEPGGESFDFWNIIHTCTVIGRAAQMVFARLGTARIGRVDYYQYIHSDEWRRKAEEAKARAGQRCQACNRHRNEVQLQAHHRTYARLGHEKPGDIFVMCDDCHEAITREMKRRKRAA